MKKTPLHRASAMWGPLCRGFRSVGACIAPTPPRKRWQGHAHGRFTPVLKKALLGNGRLRRSTASVFSAIYARRTTAPQGAVHQFPVRSRCSLLVASISDGFATGAYAQQAPAALIHHSSFIIGLWPRGCLLVLLQSGCEQLTFNCDTVALAHLRAPSACAGMQTRCASSVLRCAL